MKTFILMPCMLHARLENIHYHYIGTFSSISSTGVTGQNDPPVMFDPGVKTD